MKKFVIKNLGFLMFYAICPLGIIFPVIWDWFVLPNNIYIIFTGKILCFVVQLSALTLLYRYRKNIIENLRNKKINKLKNTIGLGLDFDRPIDERIAILEMLLWKYHIKNVPNDVCDRLIKNGFMEETNNGTLRWTELSNKIGNMFNEKFNYIKL